jgi:hypothetical protein
MGNHLTFVITFGQNQRTSKSRFLKILKSKKLQFQVSEKKNPELREEPQVLGY